MDQSSQLSPPRRPAAGTAAVLIAVSVWGSMAVVTRLVDQVNGLVVAFHRLWIGCLATVAVFYGMGGRLSWRTLRLSVTGGLAFGADIVLFFSALRYTTVANATIVGALQPVLVLLIAGRMFGEQVTATIVSLSAIAIAGVAIVVYGSSGAPVWSVGGDLLAIAALFAWTAYFVASRQVRKVLSPFEYLSAMLVVATVALAPVAFLSGSRLDPGGLDAWGWIALLAIGSGGFGHLLVNWAHNHIDLTVMSLLTLAIPVFAVVSAAIFVDETITWTQVLGMAVVLGALAFVAIQSSRTAAIVAEAPAAELAD
jgi:drug/metabolite transporter (DMT)-like permease